MSESTVCDGVGCGLEADNDHPAHPDCPYAQKHTFGPCGLCERDQVATGLARTAELAMDRERSVAATLEAAQRDLALALKDNANYRGTVQRLMRENRELKASHADCARTADLERAVVEALRKHAALSDAARAERYIGKQAVFDLQNAAAAVHKALAALDAAQQQPQHASAAHDDGQDARQ